MSTTRSLGVIVGATLALFALVFGTALLFGFLETPRDVSVPLFKTLYFAFLLLLFGAVYLATRHQLGSALEHVLIALSLIALAASIATLAGGVKGAYDADPFLRDPDSLMTLQAQGAQQLRTAQSLAATASLLRKNDLLLTEELVTLEAKLDNRTPIVVETVITLPPEIIYVEEETPTVYYDDDYEDDDEEEEYDD
jgi:hypothetical protein